MTAVLRTGTVTRYVRMFLEARNAPVSLVTDSTWTNGVAAVGLLLDDDVVVVVVIVMMT